MVYNQYELMYDWFDTHRDKSLQMEKPYLDFILKAVPLQASILDLGCGTAEPIAKYFIENGCRITGIDGSKAMIELCMQRYPNEHWITADMCTTNLKQQFDVIIAWHSLFHLNHADQRKMFQTFALHSKPGGILAFTTGHKQDEVWSNNGGQMLYHASLSAEEYQTLLSNNGFELLIHKQEDPGCGDATVWVARKQLG